MSQPVETVQPEPVVVEQVPAGATPPEQPDESLGEGGKKALEAERKAHAAAKRDLAAMAKKLQDIEDAKLSETDKLRKDAATAAEQATATAAENLRLRFANDNGVPSALADRLRGTTAEEIAADWATLKPTLVPPAPTSRVPAPVSSQGPQTGAPQNEDDLLYEKIYGPQAPK